QRNGGHHKVNRRTLWVGVRTLGRSGGWSGRYDERKGKNLGRLVGRILPYGTERHHHTPRFCTNTRRRRRGGDNGPWVYSRPGSGEKAGRTINYIHPGAD